jgi:taurine dioxygenase
MELRMKIEYVSRALGARISNIDLNDEISAADLVVIDALWRTRHLLIFSDQHNLSVERQIALCSHFAPVVFGTGARFGRTYEVVSNTPGHLSPEAKFSYHMDYCYLEHPLDGISLYAMAIPADCAPTLFASNAAPLEQMPVGFRALLERLTVRNVGDFNDYRLDIVRYKLGRAPPDCIAIEKPLVWPHPVSGIRLLRCSEQMTERVLELTDEESAALFERLFAEHLYHSSNVYAHRWQRGDLLVWDNLALQHCRNEVPLSKGERTFRRVTMSRSTDPALVLGRIIEARSAGRDANQAVVDV